MKSIKIIILSCILLLASSLKAQGVTPTPTLTPKTDSLRKVKEFGLGFTSLQSTSYSLQYRWGNTKRLFRVNATIAGSTAFGKSSSSSTSTLDTLNSNSASSNTKSKTPLNLSTGLSVSMLNFKYIIKKFGIIYGPMLGLSYSTVTTQANTPGTATNFNFGSSAQQNAPFPTNNTTNTHTQSIQPYIGFVVGAFYKINKSFFLYAEITPNLYYTHTNSTSNNTSTNINTNNFPSTLLNSNQSSNTSSSNNTFGIASLSNSLATLTIVYRITGK
jgi:hypothetical protein